MLQIFYNLLFCAIIKSRFLFSVSFREFFFRIGLRIKSNHATNFSKYQKKKGLLLRFQNIFFSMIAALLVAVSFACSLTGCSKPAARKAGHPVTLVEENEKTQESEDSEETTVYEMDAEYYLGETTFIGDSRTNGLLTYQLLPPEQVFAIDGSTQKTIREQEFIQLEPNGAWLSVQEAVKQRQPHRLLIAFGVNAIPLMTEEEFMEEYDILIDQLVEASPNSKIVIQSILPVSWWKHESMPYLTNENIDHFNSLLKEYSEEHGYTFFDISDHFKDEDGSLSAQFDAGDGLHFNQSFYQEYLRLLVSEHP